jgi:hypothetical protein
MSGEDEYAELIEELRAVKQQNEHYRIQLGAAREMNASLASVLGKMEQQRNHARWKYGRAKRKWRETRKELKSHIAALQSLYWATDDFKNLSKNIATAEDGALRAMGLQLVRREE